VTLECTKKEELLLKNRMSILFVALAMLLCSPVSIAGQSVRKLTTTVPPSKVEPLRVFGGELHANTVKGQVRQGFNPGSFSLTLTKAEIISGRLQVTGDFALDGARPKTTDQVTATIGGVMSTAANPWPNARQSNLQSETSTACGVLFLKLTLPGRLRARIRAAAEPLQLGVVLKPFDNQRGEKIFEQICLLQASESPNQSATLNQLNRLFVLAK